MSAVTSKAEHRMMDSQIPQTKFTPALKIAAAVGVWFLVTIIFAVAYTQSPLYEGNQNTKFLHGLAEAGQGYLSEDWLANTVDPLPVFTFIVYVTALVNENLFYLYYALILGIYVFSVMGILSTLYKDRWTLTKQVAFFTFFLIIHAGWSILRIEKLYNYNIEYLQYGVAGQYLLGIEFQNSVFGVFLLLSIYAFLKKKYYLAAFLIGATCLVHSAYLFSGALITIAYLLLIFWDNLQVTHALNPPDTKKILRAARQPFFLGLFTALLVLPVLWHNQVYLSSKSPETSAAALDIIVHQRIPHHAVPSVFWNSTANLQVALIVIGLLLAYRSRRLFFILLSLFIGGALVSLVQLLTDNDSLAMMAPWRVSVLLVPISVALILAFIVSWLIDLLHLNNAKFLMLFLPLALYVVFINVGGGINLQDMYGSGRRERRLVQMMDIIKENKKPGDVYLIPPTDNYFDDFRVYTGAPIFVNWKSHPYKDTDVLEWYKRNQLADQFYKSAGVEKCNLLRQLVDEYHITHVVFKSKEIPLACDFATEAFRIENFVVYDINP
jgi:Domain of unknown function (DUF6798)